MTQKNKDNTYAIDKVKTINGKEFRLINLPFYLISALPHILENVYNTGLE